MHLSLLLPLRQHQFRHLLPKFVLNVVKARVSVRLPPVKQTLCKKRGYC